MGTHTHKQYIKGERVGKRFLKDQISSRKAQTKRENCLVQVLCDMLVVKPDSSESELFDAVKHVDRIVNSERMWREGEQRHDFKYRHLFNHSREPFSTLKIDPCTYKLDKRKTVQDSMPFTNGAYRYIIKQVLQELDKEE